MPELIDVSGQRFHRLVAIKEVERRNKRRCFECRCDCGSISHVLFENLRSGHTQSCGCYHSDMTIASRTFHGHAKKNKISDEYNCWQSMKNRCKNGYTEATKKSYKYRGITICNRWSNSFENFYDDMGPKPSPEYSIERINNNGNYEPGNCKWATASEQVANRKNMSNLSGETFYDLYVLSLYGRRNNQRIWLCRCCCGSLTKVSTGRLKSGHTKSCGCRRGYWSRYN